MPYAAISTVNRWTRRVLLPALFVVALAAARPAFAQDGIPIDDLVRGINTLWVVVAAMLVFFMQAGFALVEAGLTRAKNTVNILFKNVMDFIFVTLAFWTMGYAFMFGNNLGGLIGTSGFALDPSKAGDVAGLPVMAFWFFQLVFAGTAATIVSGAMAERTQFVSYLMFSFIITAFIYPIAGHWIWGGGWLSSLSIMGGAGFRDFAGSSVVRSVGGWPALVGTLFLGPRLGRFARDGSSTPIPGHSMTLATLGTFILWLGWFGFNPGSTLAAVGSAADDLALVAANTVLAAAAGGLVALAIAWARMRKPDLGNTLNGVLGGLMFAAIKRLTGLRVSVEEEMKGLDYHEHGAQAYRGDVMGDWAPARRRRATEAGWVAARSACAGDDMTGGVWHAAGFGMPPPA